MAIDASNLMLQQLDAEMASVVESARRSLVEISNGHRGPGVGVGVPVHVVKRYLKEALQRTIA